MSYLTDERVVMTSGARFLGTMVVAQLRQQGCRDVVVPRSLDYDLVAMSAVRRLYVDATSAHGTTRFISSRNRFRLVGLRSCSKAASTTVCGGMGGASTDVRHHP